MPESLIVELDLSDPELAEAERVFTAAVKAILAKRARTSAQVKIDDLQHKLEALLTRFLAEQGKKIADQVVAAVEKRRAASKKVADPATVRHAFGYEKVVLIRHAEKPDDPDDVHLSSVGQAHAERLATEIPERYGVPDVVFAAANTNASRRCVETAQPLVDKYNLPFQHDIDGDDVDLAARDIRKYEGKFVLVVWKHEHLPELATALGKPEHEDWPDDDFSTQWEIAIPDVRPEETGKAAHTDLAVERQWFEDAVRNWPEGSNGANLSKGSEDQARDDHGRFASSDGYYDRNQVPGDRLNRSTWAEILAAKQDGSIYDDEGERHDLALEQARDVVRVAAWSEAGSEEGATKALALVDKIGPQSFDALMNYTNPAMFAISERMRAGTLTPEDSRTVEVTKDALAKMPEATGDVYRGVGFNDEGKLQSFLDQYKRGAVVSDKAFVSASTSAKRAADYSKRNVAGGGKWQNSVLLSISGGGAREIWPVMGMMRDTREAVFNPDTRFHVDSVRRSGSTWRISLSKI